MKKERNKNNKIQESQQMAQLLNSHNIKIELTPVIRNELQSLAIQIERKQTTLMKSRLEREESKQTRLKDMQSTYNSWLKNKANSYHLKLQKIGKNKESQIAKTVKRCKDREKFVNKKLQDCKKTRKKSLNAAWKKAGQLNDNILQYYKCRYNAKKKQKESRLSKTLNLNLSHNNDLRGEEIKLRKTDTIINKTNNNNSTNVYNSVTVPESDNQNRKITKFNSPTPKKYRLKQPLMLFPTAIIQNNEILQKIKEKEKQNEDLRIQQLGEKFEKIQQTRFRRMKKHQKKVEKNKDEKRRNLSSADFKKSPNRVSRKKQQDVPDHEDTFKRQSRLKDRSLQARLRREEMFEQHLADGEQYLQYIKVRHLKNLMTKFIAYNALEKKLYQQRLNN